MNVDKERYVTVALLRKMPRSLGVLTYSVPRHRPVPSRGTWVLAPFRTRKLRGVVWEPQTSDVVPDKNILPFSAVLDIPPLTDLQCRLVAWLADTYGVSISHALTTLLPAMPERVHARAYEAPLSPPIAITIERKRADELRRAALRPQTTTTVYTVGALRDQMVLLGTLLAAPCAGQTLVVVPTRSMLDIVSTTIRGSTRPRIVLDPETAMSDFWTQWSAVRSVPNALVFSTRKGLGAPFRRLTSIIVLNWNDPVLHHAERNPRYDGRALLLELARLSGAGLTVLDAVVPYDLSEGCEVRPFLPRPRHRTVVSLRDDRRSGNHAPLSDRVIETLRTTRGPVLVFLNRRGATRQLSCPDCGWSLRCSRDELPLVEHEPGIFRCHVCSATSQEPPACPDCRNARLVRRGKGTQTLERFLRTALPGRSVVRVDTDGSLPAPAADIVVATEKIFAFQSLEPFRCCVIVSIESEADLPSYAAIERAYALFERVAGLCTLDGQLLLQTWRTDAPLVRALACYDARSLYAKEREVRSMLKLPPTTTVVKLFFASRSEAASRTAAADVQEPLRATVVQAGWAMEGPFFRPRRGKRAHESSYILRSLSGTATRGTLRTILRSMPDDWLCEVNPGALFAS